MHEEHQGDPQKKLNSTAGALEQAHPVKLANSKNEYKQRKVGKE
jgi:hypothetical protein